MSVTEHLMRPGAGSIRFTPDTPAKITSAIFDLINENTTAGVGAHIVITPVEVDPDQVGDAAVLGAATYTGRITKRPDRLSLEFVGLGSWLDTYIDSAVTRTAGTPAQWLTDLLTNDLSAGTNTASGTVTKTFPAYITTHREALDAVCGIGSWEYRISPDMTVNIGDGGEQFVSPPIGVVTRKSEGLDGAYRGFEGGLLDQSIDVSQIATKAVALAEGSGATIAVGSDTTTTNLNAPKGTAPDLVTVLSAPGEETANAGTLATNFLNLQSQHRNVTVTSVTHHLPRHVHPGDEVYLYDPLSGLIDANNQIEFRGETITPILVRLLSYTWPIEAGVGVYIRSNETTATYHNVTPWIAWETGTTEWVVGDWNPPSYGRVNRSNPEIELRVAG